MGTREELSFKVKDNKYGYAVAKTCKFANDL
jgi:hypothetical protein